jgi:hypothetical protein
MQSPYLLRKSGGDRLKLGGAAVAKRNTAYSKLDNTQIIVKLGIENEEVK